MNTRTDPVVELDRELDDELALGDPEDLAQAGLDVEVRGGSVVLRLGGSERAGAGGGGRRARAAWRQRSSVVIGAPWTAAMGSSVSRVRERSPWTYVNAP